MTDDITFKIHYHIILNQTKQKQMASTLFLFFVFFRVPSDTDLFLKYHSDVSWQMFRSKICTTLHKEIKGQ